jgi:diguanylate cyclase
MFEKRKGNAPFSTSDSRRPSNQPSCEMSESSKLKDIISMLLNAISIFTEDNEELNSKAFKGKLDLTHARLRKTSDVQELTKIEESLKNWILRQREAEKIYSQNRHAEYVKIMTTLIEAIHEFTSDNDSFNNRLDQSLSQLGCVAELDNLKHIRYQVAQSANTAQKTVQEKQEHDNENQKALSQKIEDLETQLKLAQEEMLIDDLTKLFNRRAFDNRIQEEIERSKLLDQGFGFVLFDIDHFKNFNDTYGHLIGNHVLIAVARQAKGVLRLDDFVARYGGEEFAIISRGPSIDVAWQVAERLRNTIAGTEFGKIAEGSILRITISGGIAWYRNGDTSESLIHRADQCLYLAKGNGRNQMCMESDLETTKPDDTPPLEASSLLPTFEKWDQAPSQHSQMSGSRGANQL